MCDAPKMAQAPNNVLSQAYALTAQNNNMMLMALKMLNISQIWLYLFAIIYPTI